MQSANDGVKREEEESTQHLSFILPQKKPSFKYTIPFIKTYITLPPTSHGQPDIIVYQTMVKHNTTSSSIEKNFSLQKKIYSISILKFQPSSSPKTCEFLLIYLQPFEFILHKKLIFRQPQHEFLNISLFIIHLQFQLLQPRLFYISIIFSVSISSTSTILYIHNRIFYNKKLI